ncbi:MAG TPA: Ku protein [Usitatibacter sp.]|jgi:DNA end-binding protein Ku|nr:Ku protein [Usitatibacter sp.]
MPREIWKGSILFGLVQIPVSLYPAEQSEELSFTMLDRRDLQPVGYKRYNKSTGNEVPFDQIVKGYEVDDGRFVTLEKEDFKRANVEATQTVEIVGFIDGKEIAPYFYESPYFLAPGKHGEKGYALLREVLQRTGKVAIATVVIRTRQHIAAVYAFDKFLILDTLRYPNELRDPRELKVPESLKDANVRPNELAMAERLIEDMTIKWDPAQFHDTYRDDLLEMIHEKAKGRVREVPKAKRSTGAEVIDFASLLEKSLKARKAGGKAANDEDANEEAAPRREPRKRAAAKGTRRKAAASKGGTHHRRAA